MYVSHEELLECVERTRQQGAVRKYANGQEMTHRTIAEDVAAFLAQGRAIDFPGPRQDRAMKPGYASADDSTRRWVDNSAVSVARRIVLEGSSTGPKPKACNKCGIVKPPEKFPISDFGDGKAARCYACRNRRRRQIVSERKQQAIQQAA